jgi:DNA-binding transcriptional MerR regulator
MNSITFDTLKFAKRLKKAGIPDEQADAIVDLQRETLTATLEQARHDYHLDEIATKRDLKELELKIEVLRAETKMDLAETKAELIRWVVGVGILQLTIITALLLKLAKQI